MGKTTREATGKATGEDLYGWSGSAVKLFAFDVAASNKTQDAQRNNPSQTIQNTQLVDENYIYTV